jgi:xanthosine utilization system XapX-like protein
MGDIVGALVGGLVGGLVGARVVGFVVGTMDGFVVGNFNSWRRLVRGLIGELVGIWVGEDATRFLVRMILKDWSRREIHRISWSTSKSFGRELGGQAFQSRTL